MLTFPVWCALNLEGRNQKTWSISKSFVQMALRWINRNASRKMIDIRFQNPASIDGLSHSICGWFELMIAEIMVPSAFPIITTQLKTLTDIDWTMTLTQTPSQHSSQYSFIVLSVQLYVHHVQQMRVALWIYVIICFYITLCPLFFLKSLSLKT